MSKLSFRARALDATKPMPIYKKDELSDLQDYSVLNRAVPQMPSGMEKEEESEHHLQRAISAQQVYGDKKVMVIPVPEAEISLACYNNLYKKSFRLPKHYVHNQAQALNSVLEQEKPDYDMDSEDERWVKEAKKRMGIDVDENQFEEMIDRLEKSCGNQIVTLQEAKLLLKEDDDLIKAVYDYWTKKRLRNKGSLLFQIRQDRRDGSSNNDCYVAFRRRTEKMQTRKNRKNDEASYEKMLKLRREVSRAVTILEMVKRREKSKRELLHLTLEVYEKRYQLKDWDGKSFRAAKKEFNNQRVRQHFRVHGNSASSQYRKKRLLSASLAKSKPLVNSAPSISRGELDRDNITKKKKRQRLPLSVGMSLPPSVSLQPTKTVNERLTVTKKVTSPLSVPTPVAPPPKPQPTLSYQEIVDTMTQYEFLPSSDEDSKSPVSGGSPTESFDPKKYPDGIFTFRRKPGCAYHAPRDELIGDWPWMSDPKHRYSVTSLSVPDRCVGFARRRVGRGGRILLDRAHHPYSQQIEQLDLGNSHHHLPPTTELEHILKEIKENRWSLYKPSSGTSSPESSSLETDPGSSSQHSFEFGKNFDLPESKSWSSRHHGVTPHKQSKSTKSHRKSLVGDAPLLDKSSITFAVSALVTASTSTSSVVTSTTNSTKSSHLTSSLSQCKVSSEVSKVSSMQKCVTCGGIVNPTSTVTNARANASGANALSASAQHRVLPVALSLATTMHQSSSQRTTVLPATVTVSMSRAGGGTQTAGVPALLRISSSGAVVGGTVLYPGQQTAIVKSDEAAATSKSKRDVLTLANTSNVSTATQARRTFTQRGAVNVNLALPANVRINSESAGMRATQSAPNSPRAFQGQSGDGSNIVSVKSSRPSINSKTINLNLSSLATSQVPPFISAASQGNQVLNTGRIAFSSMLKLGGAATLFSVPLPQSKTSSSAASSTPPTGGSNTALVGEGNKHVTKADDSKHTLRTKNSTEQPNSKTEVKPMTLTTLKKSASGSAASDDPGINHTVQISLSSPKLESGTSTNMLDPIASVVTVSTNTAPVKSSKPSRPMEVT